MSWVAVAVGGGALLGGLYSANQQRSAANSANQTANTALDYSLVNRYTNNNSFVHPRTGEVNLDPSIRGLQQQSLSYIPGYQNQLQSNFGNYSQGLGGILSGLQGNQNAYIQARQAPLQQAYAQQSGALQQGNVNRGIAGSSFGNQSLTNLGTDYGTAIGNAGALGMNDSLNAQSGLYGNLYNAGTQNVSGQSALTNQYNQAGQQNLQQELASLGLSQANIQGVLGAGDLSATANQNYMTGLGGSLGALGSAFGGIANMNQQYQNPYYQQYGWTNPQYNSTYGGGAYGGSSQWAP